LAFKEICDCRRSRGEQQFIWAALEIWNSLPEQSRWKARRLIEEIARTPGEGRALYDVLVRGMAPPTVSQRTGVQRDRVYDMRREFYDRFWP